MGRNTHSTQLAAATRRLDMPVSTRFAAEQHPHTIVQQLGAVIKNMEHIDDMFLWLSHVFTRYPGANVTQFWVQEGSERGRLTTELRAMARRTPSLPEEVVLNKHIKTEVEDMLSGRYGMMPRAVGEVFPQAVAKLLGRYQLRYWACYFLGNSALLPPGKQRMLQGKKVPLTMIVSCFLPYEPNTRFIPTIGHTLEQAMPLAKRYGLLLTTQEQRSLSTLSPSSSPDRSAPKPAVNETRARLLDLIPKRTPVSHSKGEKLLLNDKQSPLLYEAIDDRHSVAELLRITHMKAPDFYGALHELLSHRHVHLYLPDEKREAGLSS